MGPPRNEPIAIVGSACRFPGESSSSSKLWDLLSNPRDVLTKIPSNRFDPDGYYNKDGEYHGSSNVTESYLLTEDHRVFDAQFFKIKPVEAHCLDPQQRLLMETVYESLESAGFAMERMHGSDTAVYVGLMCEEYGAILAGDVDQLPTYTATATARSIMSNRVSYFFDWHGPCMTIDTACSSSLVAVHQAVETLRSGTSKVAIAAGSNLLLGPMGYITESKLHMLSPGSRSRMWDADADGYARGEGVAALVLKTLSEAIRDGDHIECLIRETGVNQDGRTTGITMPSSTAQEALIRSTYAKAGLDLTNPMERCQFFEAHGTGTPAGDPIEASAIQSAFFGPDNEHMNVQDKLYVGSIKTVIGHTEGTAGIAAVMKASLAIQNATIPPNMWFNQLSAAVAPFYNNLEIASEAQPWPALPKGIPRRASVNSFGFGGTNAHAIIEQYEPETAVARVAPAFLPFPISAASENSLLEQARRMSSWLRENPNVSLPDLSWTLNSRRSAFPFRWHFSASTTEQLAEKLDNKLQADYEPVSLISSSTPRILGIFTGQGAQYAAMAASLVERSRFAEAIVDKLEASLSALPDAPTWSLKAELLAVASQSRISEAALSQPLCTAVQILLVDMLREAGIRFTAVVGHSSGEIGAAYAAGLLRPEDAIRIAYYRGVHSKLAWGRDGQMGAMLAVGTSLDDAREFCAFEDLQGRITVAACNSPSSVTLSGDADAIEEAKEVLEDEGKFVRMLRVDTAYHSHHMLPCSEPYLESLRRCAIKIQDASANPDRPAWFSSVCEQEMTADVAGLDGEYWKDNMVNTVMFSQALEKAISTQGPFDFAFEIGPHPALQGPALQTINEATGSRIPYTGVLSRGVDAIEAFAEALGYAWRHLNDTSIINLRGYDRALSGDQPLNLLKGLPSYAFDHERIYWRESRLVKATRTRTTPYHQLLGIPCPDGTHPTLMRWKNLLNPKEIPWLDGHVVQGRPVFPGTGYMSMAIDACRALAASLDRKIQFLEIEDFVIGKAIVFDERSIGVETMLTLSLDRALDARAETFSGSVCMYAALANSDVTSLPSRFTCRVQVGLASPGQDVLVEEALLPPRTQPITNFVEVEPERFYSHLARVGYEYSGLFQGLTGMKRTLDEATALVHNPSLGDPIRSPTLHPAMLDCVIQSVILAFCYPGDGKLYTLHVPTKIKRILINLPLLEEETRGECLLPVDSVVNATSVVSGDAHLFATDGVSTLLQLQGIEVAPLTPPTADNDAQLFFTYELGVAVPDGELMMNGQRATEGDYEFSVVAERIGYYFLKNLLAVLTPEDIEKSEWHHKRLVNFARKVLADLQSGTDPFTDPAWYHDTKDMIYDMMERYKHKVEITLARRVGENLPAAVRGETVILEHMVADNVLNDLYSQGLGFVEYSRFLAEGVAQLVHRYPHMNILEIGAGTGGATKVIVPKLGKAFSSYTFTDISGGFFPTAQQVFRDYSDCMMFKVLDVEKDVLEQGFKEGAYDVVVASLVLHATRDLDATVRNVRRLLKPGGYLYMLELTNLRPIRTSFTMSGLQGWWMGSAKDGREFTPCVDANQWNTILQNNGFSSIDAITPDLDPEPWPSNIIVAQAVDDRVMALRRPLSAPVPERKGPELIILGGNKLQTSLLAEEVERLVSGWFTTVRRVLTLEDLAYMDLEPRTTVLSLTDLDSPIFRGMTADRLEGLKRVSGEARNVLWLLRDARAGDPHLSMTVGFGRTAMVEMPQLRLQFLDFSANSRIKGDLVAETLLRQQVVDDWDPSAQGKDLLWSTEPELVHDGDRLLVQRLVATKDRNDRYNSNRRPVTKQVSSRTHVSINGFQPPFSLEEMALEKMAIPVGTIAFEPRQSLLLPLRIASSGKFYLSIGKIVNSGTSALALSKSLSSTLHLPSQWTFPCVAPIEDEDGTADCLTAFAASVLAHYVVKATTGTKVLAHNVPLFLVEALQSEATRSGVQLIQSETADIKRGIQTRKSVISIHPRTSIRNLRGVIPKDVSLFVDFSAMDEKSGETARMLTAELGKTSLVVTARELFGSLPLEQPADFPELTTIASLASEIQSHKKSNGAASIIPLSDVPSTQEITLSPDTIVSWTSTGPVPVRVDNIDAQLAFKPDHTYLLFGLSGELGRSLATWMVRHGARHIVLTSRHPVVDEEWVRHLNAQGAHLRFVSNDITDRAAVAELIAEIRASKHPIAGVANGAMVLQDTPVRELSLDVLNRTLRPKVDGSRYLDELLRNDDLDFTVFFSSLASIFGSHGQSSYTTANMYMTSLAGQRRRRGYAASVIAIGAVTGIGYMARELTDKEMLRFTDSGYSPLSERDFHQLFAEAIVICGVNIAQPGDKRPISWMVNPMIGHCIIKRERSQDDGRSDAVLPVKASLMTAKTKEAAFNIIKDPFLDRLQGMLQSENQVPLNMAADELGVDSLVAVDIRSWFLKEVLVDLPVLKILGGASIADMLEYVVENMPPELIPLVDATSTLDITAAQAQVATIGPDVQAPIDVTSTGKHPDSTSSDTSDTQGIKSASASLQRSQSPQLTPDETPLPTPLPGADSYFGEVATKDRVVSRSETMSFGQSRFWFLQHYLEDKTAFNIATMITVKGNFRVNDFRDAVATVAHHHEALRTRFYVDERGQPMQSVLATPTLALNHVNISDQAEARAEFTRMKNHVYDLENGETMQISLYSDRSSATHYLMVGYHHINMDGISLGVLLMDLHKVYRGSRLPPVLQYPDFAVQQRAALESGGMAAEVSFWKNEFATLPPVLPIMPFSMTVSRRALTHYAAHKAEVTVEARVASQIKALAKKCRVTPFHIYLAIFRVLLARLTGVTDVAIGMGDANRTERGTPEAIGMFLNLLPLRFQGAVDTGPTFEKAVQEAKAKVMKALAHSRVPLDVILNELNVPRAPENAPLFQAFIDYRQPLPDRTRMFDCRLVGEEYVRGDTAYDVVADIIDTHSGEALVQVTVPTLLYSASDASVLLTTFMGLLDEFTKTPTVGLADVPLYSKSEVQKALDIGRGPCVDSKWQDIVARIHDVVNSHGDLIAVRDGCGGSLTYKDLDSKVRDVCHALHRSGVGAGSVVTVLQEPTVDWAISVIATLCLGAVYVPLDARLPQQRIAHILRDCGPAALLAHAATTPLVRQLQDSGVKIPCIINVEDCVPLADGPDNVWTPDVSDSHRPAFILYTSGSTGVPKGVVLKQSNLLSQVEATVEQYGVGPGSVILQQTAYSFDISMWQLLMAVTSGAALFITPAHSRGDPLAVSHIMAAEHVTHTVTTPSEYSSWLHLGDRDALRTSAWRKAISCGETLTPGVQAAFRQLGKADLGVVNSYGPCEVTFVSHSIHLDYMAADPGQAIPIGRSLPNYSTYVVDDKLNPLPIGVKGQIAVGGAGVALGYLGQEQLTKECFTHDPLAVPRAAAQGWTTMYLTGDGGALRHDGSLLFSSRLTGQTQIKLRGMRFDLQDVETNILQASKGVVAEAVVSLRGQQSDTESQFLAAHVKFAQGRMPDDHAAYLRGLMAELPVSSHMKPVIAVSVTQMPLTISSKIDRAAIQQLPLPDLRETRDSRSSATELSEVERRMAALWRDILPSEILDNTILGPDTDFFAVGGNSLLLARLQGAIKESFNVTVPLVQLFRTSALRTMSASVNGAVGVAAAEQPQLAAIDWDKEIELPPSFGDAPIISSPLTSPPRNIVLTGATGFLGQALLARFVADPSISRIDCIAVRNTSSRTLPPIFHTPAAAVKIRVFAGDLTAPNLGLTLEDATDIFTQADAIVHNAASVSFLKTYHSLRGPNVTGTRNVLSLAAPRRIPIHFVSTAGVAHLAGTASVSSVSIAQAGSSETRPPTNGTDGYVASKWASEAILERAAAAAGVPVWIHRPSSIMGEGAARTDLMTNLLQYSLALRAVSILGGGDQDSQAEAFLDFVDVETVAREIAGRVTEAGWSGSGQTMQYEYHAGEYVIPLRALLPEVEGEEKQTASAPELGLGTEAGTQGQVQGLVEGFSVIPLAEWTARAKEAGMDELVVALLETAVGSATDGVLGGLVLFPKLVKDLE